MGDQLYTTLVIPVQRVEMTEEETTNRLMSAQFSYCSDSVTTCLKSYFIH